MAWNDNDTAIAYTSKGAPIKNLSKFVAKIENYEGGLYTADGQEIRNPQAFAEAYASKSKQKSKEAVKGGTKGAPGLQPAATLFKEDGTPVWNPRNFVANIVDYDGGLYTADGYEVRNPHAFLDSLDKKTRGTRAGARGDPGSAALLYKSDGSPIWNPVRFVANIEEYDGGLFNADGKEIKNPHKFLESMIQKGVLEAEQPAAPAPSSALMYKSDGSEVWNPARYVSKIVDYKGGLFTAAGVEIRDPQRYAEIRDRSAAGASQSQTGPEVLIYKADGTPIRNPDEYVQNMKYEYTGNLRTVTGEKIKDPEAYIKGATKFISKANGDSTKQAKGTWKKKQGDPVNLDYVLFRADGSPIKNPRTFLADLKKYENDLFTSDGEPIKDPWRLVTLLEKRAAKEAEARQKELTAHQ